MSRSISLALPPEVDRAAVEAVGNRSRREQRRRHPEHRIRLRGDLLTVRTSVGGGQRPTLLKLRLRLVSTPEGLRLDGTFTVSRIWDVIGIGVLVLFLAGVVVGVIDGSWQPIAIFGVGALAVGGVVYSSVSGHEDEERVFGDDICRFLLEELSVTPS